MLDTWISPPPPTQPVPTTAEAEWLRTAVTMSLGAYPVTPEAAALIETLTPPMLAHEALTRKNKRRDTGLANLRAALGVVVGGVLRTWGRGGRPVHHTMGLKELEGPIVGARLTRGALDAMVALRFVSKADGRRRNLQFEDGGRVSAGLAPRFWPTPELLSAAVNHGITAETVDTAFRLKAPVKPPKVTKPVELRAYTGRGRKKAVAVLKPFNLLRDTEAQALSAHVDAVNGFAEGFIVTGCEAPRWRRIFTERWDMGGRWYAAGMDANYQGLKPGERAKLIGIDGEAVAEVDVRASHLTIMHGLLGLPLPPNEDLYAPVAFPRDVVKAWITGTLGKGTPVVKWSKDHIRDTPAVLDFDAKEVGAAVLLHYPFLKAPGTAVAGAAGLTALAHIDTPAALLTHRLMAIEVAALTSAMDTLRAAGVLALPMHDALLVGSSHAAAAGAALRDAFEVHAGIIARVKVEAPHTTPSRGGCECQS